MTEPAPAATTSPEAAARTAQGLCEGLQSRFLGHEDLVELLVAALLADGHVLIEGAPGLGKTRLVRTLSQLCGARFGRVQCTPDLMPSDITGGEVLDSSEGGPFRFVEGPVFCQVFLADEINRATPRTQSALLEAMEERQVTAGGRSHPLPQPFFVAATQNPIELEGTYPLPEAQLDRFLFKLGVPAPDLATMERILRLPPRLDEPGLEPVVTAGEVLALQRMAARVPVADEFLAQVARIVRATDPESEEAPPEVRDSVRWPASPRAGRATLAGARALALLRGRVHVAPEDLKDALVPSLRHRVLLGYEARADGLRAEELVGSILRRFPIE